MAQVFRRQLPLNNNNPNKKPDNPDPKESPYYNELVAIYAQFAPEKVTQVDAILREFSGREEAMFEQVQLKYGLKLKEKEEKPRHYLWTSKSESKSALSQEELDAGVESAVAQNPNRNPPASPNSHSSWQKAAKGELIEMLDTATGQKNGLQSMITEITWRYHQAEELIAKLQESERLKQDTINMLDADIAAKARRISQRDGDFEELKE